MTDPRAPQPEPLPEESAGLSARAVDKRRREFAAGRAAARLAMRQIGETSGPVLQGPDRAPIWPRGLVGSISHSRDCAVAAVAGAGRFRSLGIDVEAATPLSPRLVPAICSENEQAWLHSQAGDPAVLAKLVFSAKEAAYKCQYPISRRLFGFDGMEVQFDLAAGAFVASFTAEQPPFASGDSLDGRFVMVESLVFALVVIDGEEGA